MWALVIGVSSSQTDADPLEFAVSDAQSFRDFLSSPRGGGIPGDHIFTLLEDQATRRGVEVELEAMRLPCQGRRDTLDIFIAGHGFLTNRGIGYFIPSDGDMRGPRLDVDFFRLIERACRARPGQHGTPDPDHRSLPRGSDRPISSQN